MSKYLIVGFLACLLASYVALTWFGSLIGLIVATAVYSLFTMFGFMVIS